MNNLRSSTLLWAASLGTAFMCGCGPADAPKSEFTPNSSRAVKEWPGVYLSTNNVPGISQDLALQIARKYCRSTMGPDVTIVREEVEFEYGAWRVFLVWSPFTAGSHMSVIVSTNGSVIDVIGGM